MALDIIGLQDAIVADLNAQTFSQALTAERGYNITHVPSDLTTARAVVIPSEIETISPFDRSQSNTSVSVSIGIQKQLLDQSNAVVDPWVVLSEDVLNHLTWVSYPAISGSPQAISAEFPSVLDAELLEKTKVFISVIEITFKMIGF